MLEGAVQFFVAAIVPCALLVGLLWVIRRALGRWAANREAMVIAARAPQRIEAELLPAPSTAATEQRCRICRAADAVSWHRPSTIAAVAGLTGWSRRVRGLPELYTLARPAFGKEDFCAECSHLRDRRIDTRIHEANLAIMRVGEENALKNQQFLANVDAEMRRDVTPAHHVPSPTMARLRAATSQEVG